LRELGVGDLSVGRQVKALAAAFQGRIAAYDSALDRSGDDTELIESLRRNIFRREAGDARAGVVRIARHVRAMEAALAAQPWTAIAAGVVVFSAPRDAPIR
jgi:cytochrome b pre-mRNA-processing protein 3